MTPCFHTVGPMTRFPPVALRCIIYLTVLWWRCFHIIAINRRREKWRISLLEVTQQGDWGHHGFDTVALYSNRHTTGSANCLDNYAHCTIVIAINLLWLFDPGPVVECIMGDCCKKRVTHLCWSNNTLQSYSKCIKISIRCHSNFWNCELPLENSPVSASCHISSP